MSGETFVSIVMTIVTAAYAALVVVLVGEGVGGPGAQIALSMSLVAWFILCGLRFGRRLDDAKRRRVQDVFNIRSLASNL